MRVDQDLEVGVVRLLRKSVFDLLTTPGRADGQFLVTLVQHDQILAVQCLSYANTHFHHDIFKIGDGFLLNSEVSDKVHHHIPEILRHSCRYFAQRFQEPLSENQWKPLLDDIKMFMTRNFLYWVEVMGLLNELPAAETTLSITSQFLKVRLLNSLASLTHFVSRLRHPMPQT